MWTNEQLARLAQLADDFLALPDADRNAWLARVRERNADLAPALDAMATSSQRTSFPALPALTLPPASGDNLPGLGDEVGPYRLLSPLGRGGMGSVWLADQVDGRVQRKVAIKLMDGHVGNPGWQLRFERERDILASLSHPSIARLIDAGLTQQGQAYLVMDLIEGETIVNYVRRRALPPRACIEMAISLLEAVAYAHEKAVVHRDLKPSNVMVDRRGHVMLLDFGIAKLLQPELPAVDGPAAQLTALYGQPLTLDYASPEQVADRPVGCTSDIYSLGVLLFELLAGQRPYTLRRSSRAAIEEAILEQDIPAPSQRVDAAWAQHLGLTESDLSQQLSGALDSIVLKALQREPTQRYASADALAQDLRRWLEGRSVQAPPATTPIVAQPEPPPAPAQAPAPAPPGPSKRIRDQIREHLIPTNTVIGLGMSAVTLADLLAPSMLQVAVAMRNVAAVLAACLIAAALRPASVDRLLVLTGLISPTASNASPSLWWRRMFSRSLLLPALFVAVALTATLSMASSGGVIASQVPSLRSLQRQLLGLQDDVTAIGRGVTRANSTLDAMAAREQVVQDQMVASPLAIGLLDLQGMPTADHPADSWSARMAVYLNASGHNFDRLQLRMMTTNPAGVRATVDLSSKLGSGSGPGAVQVMLTVPTNTRAVSACLTLPSLAGQAKRTLVHRWSVALQPGGPAFPPEGSPEVRTGEDLSCDV